MILAIRTMRVIHHRVHMLPPRGSRRHRQGRSYTSLNCLRLNAAMCRLAPQFRHNLLSLLLSLSVTFSFFRIHPWTNRRLLTFDRIGPTSFAIFNSDLCPCFSFPCVLHLRRLLALPCPATSFLFLVSSCPPFAAIPVAMELLMSGLLDFKACRRR